MPRNTPRTKNNDNMCVSLARHWASKNVRQMERSVSLREVSYCLLLLLCSCFARCRHDPIIVRTASNFSTFCRFHSVCASVSMFMITIDNCLFPFLCFCFCSCAGVSDSASEFSVFVQPRNKIHHRLRQPSSCSGVWDPWPCRIPILQFEQDCSTEAMIGLFPIFSQFFSFLILESSS